MGVTNILRRNSILLDGAVYLLIESINRGLPLILLPYVTHMFSKSEVGLYSTLLLAVSYLYVVVTLSAHASINRLAGEHHGDLQAQKNSVKQVCQILVCLGLLISVFLICIIDFIGLIRQPHLFGYLTLICFCGVTQSMYVAAGAYFRATNQKRIYFLMNIANLVIFSFVALAATVLLDAGAWMLVGASGVGASVAFYFLHHNLGLFHWESISKARLKEVIHYGWPVVIADVLSLSSTNISRIFIASTIGMIALAPYHVAFTIASIISIVVQSLNAAYVPPFLAAHFGRSSAEPMRDPIFSPLTIAIMICAILVIGSEFYIPALFTKEYLDVAQYLIFPASAFCLLPIYFCLINILSVDVVIVRKKPIVMVVSTSVSVFSAIILSNTFGVIGALLAVPIGGLTAIFVSYYMVRRYTDYKVPIVFFLSYFFVCIFLIEASRNFVANLTD
ncbi:MAG TPA: lipopolysaccharide biosynthesis protein, partial [Burkholderiaceae bacterium]